MATSQKTFDQVKNILGKLDQRIDTLRTGRTQPAPAPVATQADGKPGLHSTIGHGSQPAPGAVQQPVAPRAPQPTPAATPGATPPSPHNTPGRSGYGRATPIRQAS
ncbi:MAG: hypothetical protein KIT68_03880 [Phycisphaeraceae bacterium]|nr:hypothetical protein [Phycisphaeraceae bacterium]